LATATAAATDLVTRLRVRKGIGARPAAAASDARSSQTALRARLAAVTVEGGFLGVTTARIGLLLMVVAWVTGRLSDAVFQALVRDQTDALMPAA
jgi:putative ABC transport system ATP-binding protein